jgi:CDP-glycerol glycerophosphotransferase (TagB/SpsB family)
MSSLKKKIRFRLSLMVNACTPKLNRVIIWEPWNLENNCIAVANYMQAQHKFPVIYVVPQKLVAHAKNLLAPGIKVIAIESAASRYFFCTSKYIFTAHWLFPRFYTSKQVVVNLWHGIAFKRICMMSGKKGVPAHITLATSELTKKMFMEAFGVPLESVFIAGYPRNDILLRAKADKVNLKKSLAGELGSYNKVMIWLPTRRKDQVANHPVDGIPVDNAFQVVNFDIARFNEILKAHNALCIVKPHPFDYRKDEGEKYSHILTIDDEWIWKQGITLYHLAACSDMMVSDVSSIIADYLLLDQPVICFSTDFSEYEKTRGFYFEDIERWLPSRMARNQDEFFEDVEQLLTTGHDTWEQKRLALKAAFFTYHDANSAQRLVDHVFSKHMIAS